jgi:hypothetical protein
LALAERMRVPVCRLFMCECPCARSLSPPGPTGCLCMACARSREGLKPSAGDALNGTSKAESHRRDPSAGPTSAEKCLSLQLRRLLSKHLVSRGEVAGLSMALKNSPEMAFENSPPLWPSKTPHFSGLENSPPLRAG